MLELRTFIFACICSVLCMPICESSAFLLRGGARGAQIQMYSNFNYNIGATAQVCFSFTLGHWDQVDLTKCLFFDSSNIC